MKRRVQSLSHTEKAVRTRLEAERHCYAAEILEARTGPRRELTLALRILVRGKAKFDKQKTLTIHFSAIANYAEVRKFFAREQHESLHYLRYAGEPRPRHHILEMGFDRTEDFIKIIAGNVSIVEPDDGDGAR